MSRTKFTIMACLVLATLAPLWGPVPSADAQATRPLGLAQGTNGYYIPDYFGTPNWANSPPLQKFVDSLAPLGCETPNNLGQCIPIATPSTPPAGVPTDGDYYEIALVQYREQMHSNLPAVVGGKIGGTGGTLLRGYVQEVNGVPVGDPHYLGPVIIAQKDRPVRIKFTNRLPIGAGGNLFLPVDTTIMGSGAFQIDYDPVTKQPRALVSGTFAQNRANLHLHGGRTPWISDGTPHQWITPAGETAVYPRGVSAKNVPDMPDPGAGSITYYYTNAQSARLMFYHDHAYGITRLNVYAGMAAGYLITDPMEQALINGGTVGTRTYAPGTIPATQIPLIIQDKTFVDGNPASPTYVLNTDPTWAWGSQPGKPIGIPTTGDLWWPHVYMTAQNPWNPDLSGMNPYGRWHYGPWFFPPTPVCGTTPQAVKPFCVEVGAVPNQYANLPGQPPMMPGTPNPSWGAEAFLDVMMVNGTVYPRLDLPSAGLYRFRILNASHDRFLNLQLYKASPIVGSITVTNPGSGYTSPPAVTITGVGTGATATATVDLVVGSPTFGQVTAITLDTVGSGYTVAPTVTISGGGGTGATATATAYTALTEVGMVPATLTSGFPPNWPKDGREGGVPDPATRGPAFVQIGTEGGFLPAPVVLPNQPVQWNLDPTTFNFGIVLPQADGGGTLILGPAERADVIVDFTNFAGQTLILYNDAPTAFPALVPQYDYYTGAPDRTDIGGVAACPPGFGPNIRTVMQIVVPGTPAAATPADDFNPANFTALQAAFATDAAGPGVFAQSQEPIVAGQTAYNSTYNRTFPAEAPNWGVATMVDDNLTFSDVNGTIQSIPMKRKAIHDEMGATFDDYGRMSAKLGLEVPFANAAVANFILQNYPDPMTEIVKPGEVQIWRITHNGVDTHPIHFHLFDVQLINRLAWDGAISMPDPGELGWKDTVKMNPLEDTIVALRPIQPPTPWPLPNSVRPLNPTQPLNTNSQDGFSQIDITNGGNLVPPMTNRMSNFGYEYVWHCHILSHEENDMMRAIGLAIAPTGTPSGLTATVLGNGNRQTVRLNWTDNSVNETNWIIERSTTGAAGPWSVIGKIASITGPGAPVPATFTDLTPLRRTTHTYRVTASNVVGTVGSVYPTETLNSPASGTASATTK